jgi:hypothetical protein
MADETYASAELASALRDDPGEYVHEWAGLIDDRETLEYLIYLDHLWDVPVEETEMGKEIISKAATETIDESVRAGNVSQMKAATGMTSNGSSEGEFFWEVASRLAHEGTIGLVFGSPGSGKTAKMLDVGMAWKGQTNGRIFGNITASVLNDEFYSDQEMFEVMASFKGQSLALIDEVAQELDGMGSRNQQATEFCNRMRMIRKLKEEHGPYAKRGSALLVSHTRNGTAKDIRRMASFAIEVPNKRSPDQVVLLESKDGSDEWTKHDSYSGITDTDAKYDEHQASEFRITEDDDESLSSDSDDGQNDRKRAIGDIIALKEQDDPPTNAEIADIVKERYDNIDWSGNWVGKLYRREKGEDNEES